MLSAFSGDRQGVIQYESEPVMNRLNMLPENQLTDILMSLDHDIRDLKNQPGDGIKRAGVLRVSSGGGTLTKWLMRLVDSNELPGVPFVNTATAKNKTFLLADLIIDRC